jgi:hypothetical protein
MRTIMSACLMMFLFLNICPAGADTDKHACSEWKDFSQSGCPGAPDQTAATPGKEGEKILAIGRKIVANGTYGWGSCWAFVNAVYDCAGYLDTKTKKCRATVFQGDEKEPYLKDMNRIKPGDWIMHINNEYSGREHSSIFMSWDKKEQKIANMLDYMGGDNCATGKPSQHELTKVFKIIRAKRCEEEAVK